jgi:hypothetical protein
MDGTVWYIVDEGNDKPIRGPYEYPETAVAVRNELEDFYPERDWNLQIVEKEAPHDRT